MTEREADLAMEVIAGASIDSSEEARVMLKHLYELHKLRDNRVYSEMQIMLELDDDEEISDILWEMNYA